MKHHILVQKHLQEGYQRLLTPRKKEKGVIHALLNKLNRIMLEAAFPEIYFNIGKLKEPLKRYEIKNTKQI